MVSGGVAVPGWEQHELVLVWRRLAVCRHISRALVENTVLDVRESVLGDLIVEAQAYVLGQRLPPHTETATATLRVPYPATWWQHVKYQFQHRWWMRRVAKWRPPRMTALVETHELTATWEHMEAYPWASYTRQTLPDRLGAPVRLRWMTSDLIQRPGS